MEQCYDWDNNILHFEDTNHNEFNLRLKGDKTIVSGSSASGKILLCTKLNWIMHDKNVGIKRYSADNIFIATDDNLDKIYQQVNKLIIIDRAEMLLNNELVNYINKDTKNRYLIFLRKPIGLMITPNHFAEFVRDNNTLYVKYLFDIKGWC